MQIKKNIIISVFSILMGVFLGVSYFKNNDNEVSYNSHVIQNEIKNLSKLIVTEGSYSNVYSYKDVEEYFGDWISFEKKIIVVVNAKAQVLYDMKKLDIELDSLTQTIILNKIPPPEIQVIPDVKYFDIKQSTFNKFSSDDMNKIKAKALKEVEESIELSNLKEQAEERLNKELNDIFILSKTFGWTIKNKTNYSVKK